MSSKIFFMKISAALAFLTLLSALNCKAWATTYDLPANGNDSVITEFDDSFSLTRAEHNETLLDVARRFNLGQTEIVRLNPDTDRWHIKKDEVIRLANRRILPDTPRDGITLNIAEYRMYYYPPSFLMRMASAGRTGKRRSARPASSEKSKIPPGTRRNRSAANTRRTAILCRRWCRPDLTTRSGPT